MRNYQENIHASAGLTDQIVSFCESLLARPEYAKDKRKVSENINDLLKEILERLEERGYDIESNL